MPHFMMCIAVAHIYKCVQCWGNYLRGTVDMCTSFRNGQRWGGVRAKFHVPVPVHFLSG